MPLADLSHPVDAEMPVFPGDPPVTVDAHATMAADGYRVARLSLGSHTGTHVDAPSHTESEGDAIDALPVARFVRDAVLVDLHDRGPRSRIRPADLPSVKAGAVVIRTGWADHWGTPAYRDHPYLTAAAARHCVEHGYDVALDAFSVDPTPSDRASEDEPTGVPAHHELLGNGHFIVENLTNLDAVPDRFELSALPLPIADGDGSPVRAVARWD